MWKLFNQITRHGLCTEKPGSLTRPSSATSLTPDTNHGSDPGLTQTPSEIPALCAAPRDLAPHEAHQRLLKIVGRALTIRAVDAGSCNGCELEMHALSNPYYNLEGAGIRFVASPRHADLLLVTGPVARNMVQALLRAIEATPRPRYVVALGECACSGGLFGESYATHGALSEVTPVDLCIPGCPPEPGFILQCLLTFLERLPASRLPA